MPCDHPDEGPKLIKVKEASAIFVDQLEHLHTF